MPLQDVSNDSSIIGWLRQAGHGHLLENQHAYANYSSSASPPPPPPPPLPLSPVPPPMISSGYTNANTNSYGDSYNRAASFSQNVSFNPQSYGGQQSPANFVSSPAQFIAPHMNSQLDFDIENMKRDPNTRVIQRPPEDDVVYRQRVFVRYLQPPTPPVSGAIIVREKQPPPPPPDPPIVIRRAPPPPPTPPPVTIRERPPPIPPPEPTTIINKIIPPPAKPPRQVIIEQFPPLPPKPQDVIIERWLPNPPRQRRILYERLPAANMAQVAPPRPIIVQHGQPRVRIHREVFQVPGVQLPYQQILPQQQIYSSAQQILPQQQIYSSAQQILPQQQIYSSVQQILPQQQIHSAISPSSLISYSPYTSLQQSYGSITHPQSNIVVMQSEQPNIISSSSYGMPLSCVCSPQSNTGLGIYGSGISTVPTIGYSSGQSMVYNVPENVSVDNVLRQLGVDPYSIQQTTDPHSAVAHVWNAASHANPPHSIDPHSAVSHVWNAASHANPPHSIDPHSAVSHVWNAATHANPPHSLDSHSAVSHVWNAAVHATDHNQLGPMGSNTQYNSGGSGVLSHLFGGNR